MASTETRGARRERLGVFGAEGSFSEKAAQRYAEREGLACELVRGFDLDALLAALEDGDLDIGVLPVTNSIGGLVRASFEALGRRRFRPLGQVRLAIRHHLLARQVDLSLGEVTQVVSHPQALAQCEAFLEQRLPGVPRVPWSDTASAARDLAAGVLPPTSVVLASRRAADVYDLAIAFRDVQDKTDNRTTFLVVGRLG